MFCKINRKGSKIGLKENSNNNNNNNNNNQYLNRVTPSVAGLVSTGALYNVK